MRREGGERGACRVRDDRCGDGCDASIGVVSWACASELVGVVFVAGCDFSFCFSNKGEGGGSCIEAAAADGTIMVSISSGGVIGGIFCC